MRRVVDAAHSTLAERDDPFAEVANVDRLGRLVRRCGGEDVASPREPMRPVREASGRVVRPGDQARSDDECALGDDVDHSLLAERLEWAVALVRQLVVGELAKVCNPTALVYGNA